VLTGGTDTHLLQVDLRSTEWTGKDAEERLADVKITVNRNTVPFDERPPTVASGIRIGTPAATMRGFDEDDFREVGRVISEPLERTEVERIAGKKVAVCPVLRAGLGMLDGVLSLVSSARVGFIGLYRDEETLQPVEYYVKLPELGDGERDAIVLDPMLATGRSSAAAVTAVKQAGARSVTLVCLVAAPEGIEHMQGEHPDVRIVTAAVD